MTRIGFIGAGGVAGSHQKALATVPEAELSAVYDTNSEASRSIAESSGAKVCSSVSELFDYCDAVYVLTPPHTHKDICIEALQADKHVMCEKPLAISLEDGLAIAEAAAESNSAFMTAFSMRYRASNQRLKAIYDSGDLGTPLTFWYQRMFGGGSYNPENWRYRTDSASGMSIESLSHQIDTVRWIFGDIESVYAKVIASYPELPQVDNNVHTTFTMTNGTVATIHVSWSSFLEFNTTGIGGTDGTVRIWGEGGANHDTMHQRFRGSADETIIQLNEPYGPEIMANECRGFLDMIAGGTGGPGGAPHPGAEDGLRALEVSHAMLESSSENKVVKV